MPILNVAIAILTFAGFAILFLIGGMLIERTVVPAVVALMGASNFAQASALEGSRGIPVGFFLSMFGLLGKVELPWWHWVLAFSAILTVVDVIWLWSLGQGNGGNVKEWELSEGMPRRTDSREPLSPLFLWAKEEYFQTDAHHEYSHYFLELHSSSGLLGRNGYRDKVNLEAAKKSLLAACPGCRALDLELYAQIRDNAWVTVSFTDRWTPYLCGELAELPETSRIWWQKWIHPDFDSSLVHPADRDEWRYHLEEILRIYPELKGNNPWGIPDRIRGLFDCDQPILVTGVETFYTMARKANPKASTLLHHPDGIVEAI